MSQNKILIVEDEESLRNFVAEALSEEMPHEGEIFITRTRHANALKTALTHIEKAYESLLENQSQEFVAMDLRVTMDALGEITGKVSTEDILNKIFSDFCIGK